MSLIKVELLEDWNDCETCGGGTDYGGRVWIDGDLIWEDIPAGSCYDNRYLNETDLIRIALAKLGHALEVV